jgi:hypothetical protein
MYRVRVSESVTKLVHVDDAVATDLELLPVLDPTRMKELLAAELVARGFTRDGDAARREEEGSVSVTVDLASGRVKAEVRSDENVALEAVHSANAASEAGLPRAAERTRAALQAELGRALERREKALAEETTRRLEGRLSDLKTELDQVVSRVTIEALKLRARELGEIEELTEDAATGELTIKVRV